MTLQFDPRPVGQHRIRETAGAARWLLVIFTALLLVVAYLLTRPGRVYDAGPDIPPAGQGLVRVGQVFGGGGQQYEVVPASAQALGPTVNRFSGYDLTQAKICCGGGWASAPWVTASSYYNATMNSRTNLAHDTSASIGSYYTLQVAIGQVVGLMCWLQTSTGTYWEKTDSRHTVNGASNLYIAYITDTFINVSRADLFTYVPHCGSASLAEFDRLMRAAGLTP
jgi:hypothetical protein